MFLYFFTINIIFYQVKMLMFFSVQTPSSTMVGKKKRCTVDSYSIALVQIISHIKYHILCSTFFYHILSCQRVAKMSLAPKIPI
jgi:hypothetical protein